MRSRRAKLGLLSGGIFLCIVPLLIVPSLAQPDLIGDVRSQLAQNSLAAVDSELSTYRAQHGVTPEYLEALSWMARGAAAARRPPLVADKCFRITLISSIGAPQVTSAKCSF